MPDGAANQAAAPRAESSRETDRPYKASLSPTRGHFRTKRPVDVLASPQGMLVATNRCQDARVCLHDQ